jgi:hypothetical protein
MKDTKEGELGLIKLLQGSVLQKYVVRLPVIGA